MTSRLPMLRLALRYALVMSILLLVVAAAEAQWAFHSNATSHILSAVVLTTLAGGVWLGRGIRMPSRGHATTEHTPTAAIDVDRHVPTAEAPLVVSGLSSRETQVLALLAQGHTNAQIADALFVSTNTVKTHVANIYSKLGVSNRAQAAQYAARLAASNVHNSSNPPSSRGESPHE